MSKSSSFKPLTDNKIKHQVLIIYRWHLDLYTNSQNQIYCNLTLTIKTGRQLKKGQSEFVPIKFVLITLCGAAYLKL